MPRPKYSFRLFFWNACVRLLIPRPRPHDLVGAFPEDERKQQPEGREREVGRKTIGGIKNAVCRHRSYPQTKPRDPKIAERHRITPIKETKKEKEDERNHKKILSVFIYCPFICHKST